MKTIDTITNNLSRKISQNNPYRLDFYGIIGYNYSGDRGGIKMYFDDQGMMG